MNLRAALRTFELCAVILLTSSIGGFLGGSIAAHRSIKVLPTPLSFTFNGSITLTNDQPAIEIQ
jgi:hypothetical protein